MSSSVHDISQSTATSICSVTSNGEQEKLNNTFTPFIQQRLNDENQREQVMLNLAAIERTTKILMNEFSYVNNNISNTVSHNPATNSTTSTSSTLLTSEIPSICQLQNTELYHQQLIYQTTSFLAQTQSLLQNLSSSLIATQMTSPTQESAIQATVTPSQEVLLTNNGKNNKTTNKRETKIKNKKIKDLPTKTIRQLSPSLSPVISPNFYETTQTDDTTEDTIKRTVVSPNCTKKSCSFSTITLNSSKKQTSKQSLPRSDKATIYYRKNFSKIQSASITINEILEKNISIYNLIEDYPIIRDSRPPNYQTLLPVLREIKGVDKLILSLYRKILTYEERMCCNLKGTNGFLPYPEHKMIWIDFTMMLILNDRKQIDCYTDLERQRLYELCDKENLSEYAEIVKKWNKNSKRYFGLNEEIFKKILQRTKTDEKQFVIDLFYATLPTEDIKCMIEAKRKTISWTDNSIIICYARPVHVHWIKQQWMKHFFEVDKTKKNRNEQELEIIRWKKCINWVINDLMENGLRRNHDINNDVEKQMKEDTQLQKRKSDLKIIENSTGEPSIILERINANITSSRNKKFKTDSTINNDQQSTNNKTVIVLPKLLPSDQQVQTISRINLNVVEYAVKLAQLIYDFNKELYNEEEQINSSLSLWPNLKQLQWIYDLTFRYYYVSEQNRIKIWYDCLCSFPKIFSNQDLSFENFHQLFYQKLNEENNNEINLERLIIITKMEDKNDN
ncbi:unnamed protein product [Didymodactylos carnosus]|uniref:Uncharacterized protein n=1 Tax=Didymodactylos carnosus TaxID=1234261 RepID=A0A813R731_9BILA|nr:unnamed protein product [Didymodactylos carnosus]CAF0777668.1 unnamed protein product [Didymodactylos carnosus]CAF3527932.1 unnamed protein product [Didymodactylos carnosus]CAF3560399.1 unnamed protein product [Didymodactylos carnosus]